MRAVVLRDGKLEVRETADPVPGPGELLIKPLSAAICASDVHYMDHPNSADRFVWDSDRDTVMGHEFIGEVVGHGPDCSDDFPVGTRVTSLPIMIRHGEEPLVIGHNPDAPGAFGELMLVSEVMARAGARRSPERLGRTRGRFRGGGVLRSLLGDQARRATAGHRRGRNRPVDGGRAGCARRSPIVVSDYSDDRLAYAKKFGADILVNPSSRDPYEVWRETFRANNFQTTQVIFECVGRNGLLQTIVDQCEFMARVYVAGGWYDAGTIDCTAATHKGMTMQFGGGPHPQDWYGTLDAVTEGRLDPSPSIGRIIGLDDVPDAIDQVRKGQGPPRVIVHPSPS